jgi:hypothetical protein
MVWVVLFALTPSDSMLRWVQLSGFVVTLGIFLFNLRLVGR